ncbi:hypothetical protein ACIQM4_09425 [Streptomyces sp. NPDC091272]|uniref:hypothetical protein n=1 Tax=Streptomyces sp. NPDC091272 TaxID=3365981 RepID=UPI00381E2AA0
MNASQQHMFDVYRAAQQGGPTPPAPGTHDWRTVRELRDAVRDDLRFRAAVAEQPARTFLRAALTRLVTRLRPTRTSQASRTSQAPRTSQGSRTSQAPRTSPVPRTSRGGAATVGRR